MQQIWRKKEQIESRYHVLFLLEGIFLGCHAGEVSEVVVGNAVFDGPYMIVQYIFIVFVVTGLLVGFADE